MRNLDRRDRRPFTAIGIAAVLAFAGVSHAALGAPPASRGAAGAERLRVADAGAGGDLMPVADGDGAPVVNANLPTVTLTLRGRRLVAEVASTPVQREIGLMNRFSLQPDHGMLFVFETAQPLAFWMKNTFIPLSVAFVDANGRILNIESMAPQDLATHWSQGAALYAIEMRQGWFLDHGIAAGDVVGGLPGRAGAS